MKELEVFTYQILKDPSYNGGYNHIGNGNTNTVLYLKKGDVELELEDSDINKILRSLQHFNPTIRVR